MSSNKKVSSCLAKNLVHHLIRDELASSRPNLLVHKNLRELGRMPGCPESESIQSLTPQSAPESKATSAACC